MSSKPIYVFRELLQYLIEQRIVLPGYTVLQELVGKALTEEQQRLMTLLQKQLAPHECATFDTLFADTDGLYTLTRLKHEPKDFSLGAMRQEICRQCLQVVASERSPPPQLEHAKPPARFETIRATLLGVEIASTGC
jgi:hypothetical protein